MTSYSSLDMNNWSLRLWCKNNRTAVYFTEGEKAPVVKLYERGETNKVLYSITREEGSGHVSAVVNLTPNQLETLTKIDEWVLTQTSKNSREWFGKTLTRQELSLIYSSPIRNESLRVKVSLEGKRASDITILEDDGPQTGSGWGFLSKYLDEEGGRGALGRLFITPSIWIMGKNKFGLTWTVTHVALTQAPRQVRKNPFLEDDDDTLTLMAQLAA